MNLSRLESGVEGDGNFDIIYIGDGSEGSGIGRPAHRLFLKPECQWKWRYVDIPYQRSPPPTQHGHAIVTAPPHPTQPSTPSYWLCPAAITVNKSTLDLYSAHNFVLNVILPLTKVQTQYLWNMVYETGMTPWMSHFFKCTTHPTLNFYTVCFMLYNLFY